ncbi:ATP-binding protein [Ralstonia pseudosolanacearum]|uniref:ATP-binding protein n=1 Tax=Ralstonia pseudosolanacearum TaxID=1310165 RepID=UPI001FF7D73C|nr:ATP-binding protein [Ralstonia pseudosolanacearum]
MFKDVDVEQAATGQLSTAIVADSTEQLMRLKREEHEQFKLVQVQSFNWGTFSGHLKVDVAPKGMLFIGPSGSGKSTIFDSHASLLTPPRWLNFNVAARESESRQDRNLVTYVRGVWGEQTSSAGEISDQQLRPGPTWSAIAETYRNGEGKVVTLAHVYWIRTASNASRDVGKRYLVAERELDLSELKFFPQSQYNARRFKIDLPDVYDTDAFSEYQERFRSRLGIDSEHALKLLHKTQSAKNLGGLTDFLRDFMLDEPRTREMADDLVEQFSKLDNAHNEVVSAGQQIETLMPAREANTERQQRLLRRSELDEVRAGVDNFQQERRGELLQAERRSTTTLLDGQSQLFKARETRKTEARADLELLIEQRRGLGGEQLERLEYERQQAEREAQDRETKHERVRLACSVLGVPLPDAPERHAELVDWARTELEEDSEGGGTDGSHQAIRARGAGVGPGPPARSGPDRACQPGPPAKLQHPVPPCRHPLADRQGPAPARGRASLCR